MPEIIPIEKKLRKVKLADLHIRYIPVVTPINLWNFDMGLPKSPHVELMRIFARHRFDWSRLSSSRYYKERRLRRKIGMRRWTEEKIFNHIIARYKIWRSIKNNGYDKHRDRVNPIKVLPEPFWKTRFGMKKLNGMEIWNGAGRCAAAYALGYDSLPVLMCEDAHPGTGHKGKFESKLATVKGVWKHD